MLKSYTTSAGAARARPGCPIVRILRDPEDLWVPVLALDTQVHVLTCDSPRKPPEFAGSLTLQDIVDAAIAGQEPLSRRYRHKVRGTEYELVGIASLQDAKGEGVEEGAMLVIYRGEDGALWARRHSEFHDGRFAKIAGTE